MTLLLFLSSILRLANLADTTNHSSVELQAIASDVGATPFFLSRLQYGAIPLDNPGIVTIFRNGKNYNLKKKYDWKYQIQATGWAGKQNDFWLTEAYVSGRRGNWELWAGRRKEVYGLGDTTMTSGFYAWSGNAVPIPKIQFGTRDYVDFARGHLGIFMTFAHGWLDNQGPVLDGLLHQKTLYGRIGKRKALINLFGGVNHQVMWSGVGRDGTTWGSGLNTFYYVVTTSKKREKIKEDSNAPATESGYQYGAHLGSIDLLVKVQPKWGALSIYKQTAWETGRIFKLITANDGITGISLSLKRTKLLQNVIFEYIYTANQGQYYSGLAKLLGMKDPHANEYEDNFNGTHGGWHYIDRGIGTPFLIYDMESKYRNGYDFTLNAVKGYYLGLQGQFPNNLYWKFRIAYSLHTYPRFPGFLIKEYDGFIPQTSLGLHLSKNIFKNLNFQGEIGYDQGERVTNTIGMKLGIRYALN
jgi:hypothetical protein